VLKVRYLEHIGGAGNMSIVQSMRGAKLVGGSRGMHSVPGAKRNISFVAKLGAISLTQGTTHGNPFLRTF